jgi:hypothetical protein
MIDRKLTIAILNPDPNAITSDFDTFFSLTAKLYMNLAV